MPSFGQSTPAGHSIREHLTAFVYISRAEKSFPYKEMRALLDRSRINNEKHDVTSCLIYWQEAVFIQYIEEPDDTARQLMKNISLDSNHRILVTTN
ncbi:BLUF domain-containing protein [Spongiibacter taiwanensis]|uniref:BLUF domain-containing protein n=1 Tax=Spongiibacter taiwanensis TaxID=1748242 RepID=UPI0020362939|nr:BLUF domain-containing protein [Spongiibacter taiwanensis]USA41827.1 BLUF domain-containing protein [Spongiibacter taiwanensis]